MNRTKGFMYPLHLEQRVGPRFMESIRGTWGSLFWGSAIGVTSRPIGIEEVLANSSEVGRFPVVSRM